LLIFGIVTSYTDTKIETIWNDSTDEVSGACAYDGKLLVLRRQDAFAGNKKILSFYYYSLKNLIKILMGIQMAAKWFHVEAKRLNIVGVYES